MFNARLPRRECNDGSRTLLTSFLSFLTVLFAGGEQAAPAQGVRTMTVEQRLVVRVPVRPQFRGRLHWEEEAFGPRCLPLNGIAGAALAGKDGIDFLMRDRRRVRAKFAGDCTGLDFWDGFYMQPTDRRICAGRDVISSRVGGTCEIDRFRMLAPRLERAE